MMRRMLIAVLCVLSMHTFAQTSERGNVSVKIESDNKQPVENATVSVVRAKDSVLVKAAITDKSGNASFENIKFGEYKLKVNVLGHKNAFSSTFNLSASNNNVNVGTIALLKASA